MSGWRRAGPRWSRPPARRLPADSPATPAKSRQTPGCTRRRRGSPERRATPEAPPPAPRSVGSVVSITRVEPLTRISSCRRPASSGSSSVVPATSTSRSADRAWSRSIPRLPSAFAAALVESLSVASNRWCEPTAPPAASRLASSRLVSAAVVVRDVVSNDNSAGRRGVTAPKTGGACFQGLRRAARGQGPASAS